MSRRGLRNVAVLAAALALLVGLFFALFERRAVKLPMGYSIEALINPYLALGRLLSEMGHEVVTLDGVGDLGEPLPPSGVLILPTSRRTLTRERQEVLLEWVASGGGLVAVTHTLWDEPNRRPDPLLDRFGLRQYMQESLAEEAETDEAEDPLAEVWGDVYESSEGWDVTRVYWPGLDQPLVVKFDPRFYWEDSFDDAELYVNGDFGTHMILLRHGAGWVAALTDDWFLRNDDIGEADHAEFLVRLVRLDRNHAPVWIVASERWPGLWSQARRHAAPALLSLAALLCAWLWRAAVRFGPAIPPPEPARRRWMEHLEAVGRFHWRRDRGRALLACARTSVGRALERAHPGWVRLSPPARAEQLAQRTGLAASEVARALDAESHPQGEGPFVAAVAHLERIRSSL